MYNLINYCQELMLLTDARIIYTHSHTMYEGHTQSWES